MTTRHFIIKKGKAISFSAQLGIVFFLFLYLLNPQLYYIGLLIFFLSIPTLLGFILLFRWTVSFVVFLDIEKREIILNHSLFFRKKKISLNDIKEVDVLNGNIILIVQFLYLNGKEWYVKRKGQRIILFVLR
jgi:hypothetical protein